MYKTEIHTSFTDILNTRISPKLLFMENINVGRF
jgi:hypothetical protein